MIKDIKNITREGISYINEYGKGCFIDFKKCNDGWLQYRKKTENLNESDIEKLKEYDKCIGQRDAYAIPPFIEFFTYPKFTRFEFEEIKGSNRSKELFDNLYNNILLAGWTTIDLS